MQYLTKERIAVAVSLLFAAVVIGTGWTCTRMSGGDMAACVKNFPSYGLTAGILSSTESPEKMDTQKSPVVNEQAAKASIARLTNQVVSQIDSFNRTSGPQREGIAAEMKTLVQERHDLLLTIVKTDPSFILQNSLPRGIANNLPDDVKNMFEEEVDVAGYVGSLVAHSPEKEVPDITYFLNVSEGALPGRYQLNLVKTPDAPVSESTVAEYMGREVTAHALRIGGQLIPIVMGTVEEGSAGTSGEVAQPSGDLLGEQSTLVLLGNFSDKSLESYCTTDYVRNLMFAPTNSVNDLIKQSSYGRVSFSGPVYGPFQLSMSAGTSDFWAVGDEMDRLAAAQGINARNYAKTVYVVPQISSGYIGATLISVGSAGSFWRAWMMVCNAPDVYAHEMGHLVGHWHSGTPGGGEYSDTSDIMSRSLLPLRLFSGARRVLAGWTPSANVLNLTNSGTYTLDSTALSNSSNPQTLVLPKSSTGEKYFISFRTPISYDSTLNSGYLNRVSVHSGTTANALTYLHGTLGVGESYTDSANGYTFTVNSMSTNSASVSVTMPTQQVPVCTRSNPAVSLSPISQSAAPGNAITYQVTVTNKNSSACGTSSFSFTPQVPSGWSSSYAPTSLSLDPGVTASVAWTVTSSSGAGAQSYPISTTAYDTAATSIQSTVQGSYIIATPDSTPPTVSIMSPANSSSVSGTVEFSASASDNMGIAKVEFRVGTTLIGTDTSAPYSIKWNTRKYSGSQTLTATAYDTAGNSTVSAPVTVTVTGSRGRK